MDNARSSGSSHVAAVKNQITTLSCITPDRNAPVRRLGRPGNREHPPRVPTEALHDFRLVGGGGDARRPTR
ncbi:hypothetical protein EVAR_10732_1 [Eumeta japonica]|uniref:Uncharacterized protein n=1 Tax=Eumeta variegata TaxID=151549 RepID=A0A4C1U771_EUMVA|nr:hypothetical protein EVAR_10732_1 [Eumeta japonica]